MSTIVPSYGFFFSCERSGVDYEDVKDPIIGIISQRVYDKLTGRTDEFPNFIDSFGFLNLDALSKIDIVRNFDLRLYHHLCTYISYLHNYERLNGDPREACIAIDLVIGQMNEFIEDQERQGKVHLHYTNFANRKIVVARSIKDCSSSEMSDEERHELYQLWNILLGIFEKDYVELYKAAYPQ